MAETKSKVPERIYLQWFGEDDANPDESADVDRSEVTWCCDRINDSDIEYVRVKRKKSSQKKRAEAR